MYIVVVSLFVLNTNGRGELFRQGASQDMSAFSNHVCSVLSLEYIGMLLQVEDLVYLVGLGI